MCKKDSANSIENMGDEGLSHSQSWSNSEIMVHI